MVTPTQTLQINTIVACLQQFGAVDIKIQHISPTEVYVVGSIDEHIDGFIGRWDGKEYRWTPKVQGKES